MRVVQSVQALIAAAAIVLAAASALAQPGATRYAGRPLADALRLLQAEGLRIVFSSEHVTPGMRVAAEPRARTAREVLDELLRPHGLEAEAGPARLLLVVRAKAATRPPAAGTRPEPPPPAADTARREAAARAPSDNADGSSLQHRERVTVTAPPQRPDAGVASDFIADAQDWQHLRGALADDPVRAAQALPHVAAGDDFRSEFSVRGSAPRHIGIVVDGVSTPWLRHAAYGRGDTSSIAMLNSDLLDEGRLQAGAAPQRYGNRLGAQLAFTLREGSRTDRRLRGAIGGTNATLAAEGPLGSGQRGSWIAGVRTSYLDWPRRRAGGPDGTVFAFGDLQAKLVFDVRSSQQVSLSLLAGRSAIDEPDGQTPGALGDGTNRTAVLNLGWRSILGARTVLNQRAYVVHHRYGNLTEAGDAAGDGLHGEAGYRADLAVAFGSATLEAGAQAQALRVSTASGFTNEPITSYQASAAIRSGYTHLAWRATPRVTLASGVRVAVSDRTRHPMVSPWLLSEWRLPAGFLLTAAAGATHQFPDLEHLQGAPSRSAVRPEQATGVDVSVEHRIGQALRWQVTVFDRVEEDILGPADAPWEAGLTIAPPGLRRFENALDGASRGVELLVERRAPAGLSGWVAYSFGRTRYEDETRGETFWGDADQRHGVNAFGLYTLSQRTSIAATFRAGSGFPLPGYFTTRDGALFLGTERNTVRLPAYARLDVRAQRVLRESNGRVTIFVEVLNALNRANRGLASGRIDRLTGEAIGFTRPLFPRLPTAGLVVEF